jgi:hypothetical protein
VWASPSLLYLHHNHFHTLEDKGVRVKGVEDKRVKRVEDKGVQG